MKLKVRVKLLGFLAQLVEQAEVELEVEPGSTVADLIGRLAESSGSSFRGAILDWHGNLHGGIEVILNQEHVSALRISELELWEDSELAIIPLIGGG
jgi:molybdopterin converting factor small subunit